MKTFKRLVMGLTVGSLVGIGFIIGLRKEMIIDGKLYGVDNDGREK